MKFITALALRHSNDPKMRVLHDLRADKVSFRDLVADVSRKEAASKTKALQLTTKREKLGGLTVQSTLFKSLRESLTGSEATNWSQHLALINSNVANFARRALMRVLPTNSNLHRWGKSSSDTCPSCAGLETENHILNNCPTAAQKGRYTWRHNAVLKILVQHIQSHLLADDEIFADLPDLINPVDLFTNILPDITVIHHGAAFILELTCCYERNLEKSKLYKLDKDKDASRACLRNIPCIVSTAEVSSLGFIPTVNLNKFCRSIGIPHIPPASLGRMGEMSLRCSYYIFCTRHKPWPGNLSEPYFH